MSEPTTSGPRRLGDFEIVREIGRGGMGVVYEARQVSLKRRVALKVLSGQLGLTSQAVVRFRREAEAAAKLHHTNIVPIYATGEENGTHYYAMELIEGPSLNVVIRELRHRARAAKPTPTAVPWATTHEALEPTKSGTVRGPPAQESATTTLPPWVMETIGGPAGEMPGPVGGNAAPLGTSSPPASDQTDRPSERPGGTLDGSTTLTTAGGHFDTIARLIAEVADALDYAHKQGVIHRDIKPSNLLLNPVGPVSDRSSTAGTEPSRYTSVRLSINDFGLARVLEQPGMTLTGEFMGTPRYMSPEQIAAGRAPLDHRTDIYSLGATLYELLTLEPPFPGERREQVIAQIIGKDPAPPRRINRKVPVDLETICLKALEKDPDRRYQTAGQLAADLRAYVNRFAISAKRTGPITRVIKWARRRPAVAALLGVVILLSAAACVFAYHSRLSAREAYRATEQAREAQGQRKLDQATAEALSGHFDEVERQLAEASLLGVDPGRIQVLRGFAAVERGDMDAAIQVLESALQQRPGSLAAHALLDRAYAATGRFDKEAPLFESYKRLTPVLPEDYLWGSWAMEDYWFERSVEWLEYLAEKRPTPVVSYRLARARALELLDTYQTGSNGSNIARTLTALAYVQEQMPDYNYATFFHTFTNLVAADIYRLQGDTPRHQVHLDEARQDARLLLNRYSDWGESYTANADLAAYEGRWEDAVALLREGAGCAKSWAYARYFLPAILYRLGRSDEALAELESLPQGFRPQPTWLWERAVLVAELQGCDAAEAVVRDWLEQHSALPTFDRALCYKVYCFLGRRQDAISSSREFLKQLGPLFHEDRFGVAQDRYVCGELSDGELLDAAPRRSDRRWVLCLIGLTRLADGDRAGAAAQFSAIEEPGNCLRFFSGDAEWLPMWAEVWLQRLRADPTWPPWIPVKQRTEEPKDQRTGNRGSASEPASPPQEGDERPSGP